MFDKSIVAGFKRYTRFMIGLFVCATSIVMNINAGLGVAPWEVFSTGVANVTGITIGQASIIISVAIVALNYFLGVKIGLGTLLNMLFIGIFVDLIMWLNFIPTPERLLGKFSMLVLGMVIFHIGVFLYIGIGRGAGPRDGLMVGLSNKLNKPASLIRTCLEISASIVGLLLGGSFGIGTFLTAITSGTLMGFMYKLMNFNIKEVKHIFINDYFVKKDEMEVG